MLLTEEELEIAVALLVLVMIIAIIIVIWMNIVAGRKVIRLQD